MTCSASLTPAASPTTFIAPSLAIKALSPVRNTGWSSTITTLFSMSAALFMIDGFQPAYYFRSRWRVWFNFQFAAHGVCPVLHDSDALAHLVRHLRIGYAAAVVCHGQLDAAFIVRQSQRDTGSVGMLDGIVNGFLRNSEQLDVDFRACSAGRDGGREIEFHAVGAHDRFQTP